MPQPLPAQPSLTDSAFPPFRTGNDPLTGVILFQLLLPPQLWFRAAFADALTMFCNPSLWQQTGTVSIEDAVNYATIAFDWWTPMYGYILPYAGTDAPIGTLLCDGASYLRTDYPQLFAIIGTTYGAADGTHFNVPDLRGRVAVGLGSGPGLTPRSAGEQFGEETHELTSTEMPSHTHTDTGHTHAESVALPNLTTIGLEVPEATALPGTGITGIGYANLGNTGGGDSHNNIQPSTVINYVIVAG